MPRVRVVPPEIESRVNIRGGEIEVEVVLVEKEAKVPNIAGEHVVRENIRVVRSEENHDMSSIAKDGEDITTPQTRMIDLVGGDIVAGNTTTLKIRDDVEERKKAIIPI